MKSTAARDALRSDLQHPVPAYSFGPFRSFAIAFGGFSVWPGESILIENLEFRSCGSQSAERPQNGPDPIAIVQLERVIRETTAADGDGRMQVRFQHDS